MSVLKLRPLNISLHHFLVSKSLITYHVGLDLVGGSNWARQMMSKIKVIDIKVTPLTNDSIWSRETPKKFVATFVE